jgi:GH15 family glucan-1,4-alpha-glucosidase
MSRAITIGNGNLLVGIDHRGLVRDLYFPFAGHADHVSGASGSYVHRVGVWVSGTLSWLTDPVWEVTVIYDVKLRTNVITAQHPHLQVELRIIDAVHNEKNVFLRKVEIQNHGDAARDIRLFFGQEFRISESRRGDTAFYDPRVCSIVHYKGHDAFLVHATQNGVSFYDYSVGLFDIEGKQGTYTDAEDGELSKNAIEHGSVDSVIGLRETIPPGETATAFYWIVAAHSIAEAHELHQYVLEEGPECLIVSTQHYWNAWVDKESRDLSAVPPDLQNLYKRSLEIIRVHTDNRGGIIASSDSDMLNQGRDTYSYVWPRDAAISAHALDRAGYFDTTERFFSFITKQMEKGGYLMHKYRVDGVLGSSWHPWVRNGKSELPIQEDETALVLYMLGKHYDRAKDIEFIESLFNSFIEPAADFMCGYVDKETGLPLPSYDLWEEKYGTSTYTAATVFGALGVAADISALLGKRAHAQKYRERAESIRRAITTYLYDVARGAFVKLVRREGAELVYDRTIDISSFHGIVYFGVLDSCDKRVENMYQVVESLLKVPTSFGGYMRYEGDRYYKTGNDAPPNAWCITTLWMAQYFIKIAQHKKDLEVPYGILRWTLDRATGSGILPEQIHPYTGAHLSTAPLVWSHAEYALTLDEYLKKLKSLS